MQSKAFLERPVFPLKKHSACKKKKKSKSLYLSVSLFSTAVLIGDTVQKETNIVN